MHPMRCSFRRLRMRSRWLRSPARRAGAVAVAHAQSDADFLAARAAFDAATAARSTRSRRRSPGTCSRPTSTYWQLKLGLDDAPTPRPCARSSTRYAGHAARRPAARRLAEVARQARRLERASRSTIRRPPARTPSSPATASQYRRQRDGDAALAAAKPLWFTGQTTPDACEPLFAALIARGDLADRRPPRALPARRRGRQRAPRAGDRRRPSGRRRASAAREFAARRSRSAARARARASSPGRRRRATSSRSTRSSARRAPTPASARAAWVQVARPASRGRSRLRQRAHRVSRGAPAESRRPTSGIREAGDVALTPTSRRGACARRCAPRRGPTC